MVPISEIENLIEKLESFKNKDKENLEQVMEQCWRNSELSIGFMHGRINANECVIHELEKLMDQYK